MRGYPSAFLRREALERLAGYRDEPWPEDYWGAGPTGKAFSAALAAEGSDFLFVA